MDISIEQDKQSWGVRINTIDSSSHNTRSIPDGCPEWAKPMDVISWHQRGVIVWSNTDQRVQALCVSRAIELLEKLRTTDDWKIKGITFTQHTTRAKLPERPKRKPSREKQQEPGPIAQEDKLIYETIEEDIAHLESGAAEEFFEWLQANETVLRNMAEEDKKQASVIWRKLFNLLEGLARKAKERKVDISSRSLSWRHDPQKHMWICDLPPDRGSVLSADRLPFWRGCIEQPDQFKHWSPYFEKPEDALTWVEQELASIKAMAEEEAKTAQGAHLAATDATVSQIDLSPYWIDASALEPERITYQVIIDLDYAPCDYKTIEISFGKLWRYDERFIRPEKLARELRLDMAHVTVEQPLDPNDEWYRILSRVMYYQEYIAAVQAQQLWDKSSIVQGHRDGKVIRARYGFREVETKYRVWLGGCENPDRPWPKSKSRAEYMADRAMSETLAYALDVDGFRATSGWLAEQMGDEEVMRVLHTKRARSIRVPATARKESNQWLSEHNYHSACTPD